MGVAWTKEQQKVIDLRSRNILVSAAAGSGKTAVLVERIIKMLTAKADPLSVDQLLIVTFTEAAAAEMKERIRIAIEKKSEEYPENEHLRRQATLIHNAQITTIHSFCLSVIRDHFPAIDLDPGFRIGEEGELKLLRHDILSEVLEEKYEEREEKFLDFIAAYGNSRGDKQIEELVLKIYEFSRSYPDAKGWLDSCVQNYDPKTVEELCDSVFIKKTWEHIRHYLEDARMLTKTGLSICNEKDGPKAYETTLEKDLQLIEERLSADSFQKLAKMMEKLSWARRAVCKDEQVSELKKKEVETLRDDVKKMVGDVKKQFFSESLPELVEELRICRPRIEVLTELVLAFVQKFEAKKREKDMIDFSDMEQYALRILTRQENGSFYPSVIAKEYQKQYREIMIDEYQDSNLIQETILTSISTVWEGKYNIFMVGDVKQSIYRFRLSRPELFMEKFNTYSLDDSEKQRIDLHRNFRSRQEVLESTNYIFRQIMTRGLGGIAYDEKAALYVGADYPDNPDAVAEVLLVDADVNRYLAGADEEKLEALDHIPTERELEARAIAARIKKLIREYQVVDKETGEFRPCRYSDIVILTRSVKGFADVFTEVLGREGIPAHAGTKEGYFETQEIGVMLDYLRVLDNEKQDIPLAAVLTSAFGNLTDTELAVIRSQKKGIPFFEAVSQYRIDGEDAIVREKLEQCLGMMEKIRQCVPYTPMHELLRKILRDTGYADFVYAMPGGVQRKLNLDMLSERAKAFESTSYKGLFHFVRYIEQQQKYDVDYGEVSVTDEQSDTVRIMTIHKSKGLEFPIVFVSGMGKQFNMMDARSSIVLHAGLGIGLDAIDTELRVKTPSIVKRVIQKEEVLDSLGEELRVLYVALTRAKEKLIITGSVTNLEKKLASAQQVKNQEQEALTFGRLSKALNYWDWILPALVRRKEELPIDFRIIGVEDLAAEAVTEEVDARIEKAALEMLDTERIYDLPIRQHLEEQFGYRYPYDNIRNKKLKFTVSELKKRVHMQESIEGGQPEEEVGEVLYEEPPIVPLVPEFLKEQKELTGASRGTAYHRFMELLDLGKEYTEKTLQKELDTFWQDGKMPEEMAECIRIADILKFLKSSVAGRLRQSAANSLVWKEQPFVLGVDAKEIYPDEKDGEMILVQGIIDVYFEEPDGLVVLDYKTDHIKDIQELKERYHAQLDYYARALEQLVKKPVKEKIIYSFTLQEEMTL